MVLTREGRVRAVVGDWKSDWHDLRAVRDPSRQRTWSVEPPIHFDFPVAEGDIFFEFEGQPVDVVTTHVSFGGRDARVLGVQEFSVEPGESIELTNVSVDPFRVAGVVIRRTDGTPLRIGLTEPYKPGPGPGGEPSS